MPRAAGAGSAARPDTRKRKSGAQPGASAGSLFAPSLLVRLDPEGPGLQRRDGKKTYLLRARYSGPASDLREHKLPILDAILAQLRSVMVGNVGSRLPRGSAGPTEAAIERLLDTHVSQQGGPTAYSRVGPRGGLVTVITFKVRLSDTILKEVRELLDEQGRLHVQIPHQQPTNQHGTCTGDIASQTHPFSQLLVPKRFN
jgi:hypothetical protein